MKDSSRIEEVLEGIRKGYTGLEGIALSIAVAQLLLLLLIAFIDALLF